MAGSLDIYPFHEAEGVVRFGIQIIVFVVGIILAKILIIKPAIRLHNERQKRTVGSTESAKTEEQRASSLETDYYARLKNGVDEAKNLRAQEIQAAQKAANDLILENQSKAAKLIKEFRETLITDNKELKASLPNQVNAIAREIYNKLGLSIIIFVLTAFFTYSNGAYASTESTELIPSLWYGVFWPYFQFGCFLVAIIYFGKKPILEMLEKRRDEFRARLSEAKEAMLLAERKIKKYEEKISHLQKEIAELKEQNLVEAKLERERILSEASKVSEAIMHEASRVTRELMATNRNEIKQELFNLALQEVEKSLTPEKLSLLNSKFESEAIDVIRTLN